MANGSVGRYDVLMGYLQPMLASKYDEVVDELMEKHFPRRSGLALFQASPNKPMALLWHCIPDRPSWPYLVRLAVRYSDMSCLLVKSYILGSSRMCVPKSSISPDASNAAVCSLRNQTGWQYSSRANKIIKKHDLSYSGPINGLQTISDLCGSCCQSSPRPKSQQLGAACNLETFRSS